MCGSWEGIEGIPFISTDEEPRGRRGRGIRCFGNLRNKNFISPPDVSSWKMEVEGGGLLFFSLSSCSSFSFLMPQPWKKTTSPNKKSGNKLHWIRMLGWMDASKVV